MSTKDQNALLGCLGSLFVILFILVVGSLLNGWALSILWEWFAVPALGLPSLTVVHSLGLALIVQFLTGNTTIDSDRSDDDRIKAYIYGCVAVVMKPFIYLALGWIYLQFMRG